MLLAVNLLLFCGWHYVLFSMDGSWPLGALGIRRDVGGMLITGMTAQLGMGRGFSGGISGEQLKGYSVAMQISRYSYMDTQSLRYFLLVNLQTYIMIYRLETCISLWCMVK